MLPRNPAKTSLSSEWTIFPFFFSGLDPFTDDEEGDALYQCFLPENDPSYPRMKAASGPKIIK